MILGHGRAAKRDPWFTFSRSEDRDDLLILEPGSFSGLLIVQIYAFKLQQMRLTTSVGDYVDDHRKGWAWKTLYLYKSPRSSERSRIVVMPMAEAIAGPALPINFGYHA